MVCEHRHLHCSPVLMESLANHSPRQAQTDHIMKNGDGVDELDIETRKHSPVSDGPDS